VPPAATSHQLFPKDTRQRDPTRKLEDIAPVSSHSTGIEQIDGQQTNQSPQPDVTGPSDATKAIVVIYDIFGYFDQTLQGADILAHSDKQKYKVFIPDWFKGNPCPIEWYAVLDYHYFNGSILITHP
jgi:hypothetical protein